MTSTIPQRASRPPPTSAPPTGPLPAIPISKTRKSTASDTHDSPTSPPTSFGLEQSTPAGVTGTRAVSVSGLPHPKPLKSSSTPAVPTLSTSNLEPARNPSSASSPSSAIPTPGKPIRKTPSTGRFSGPPKVNPRVSSLPPSPLSASASATDVTALAKERSRNGDRAKHRSSETSVKRSKTARSSGYGLRSRASNASAYSVTSPSLLNGTGDNKLISSADGVRGPLSMPSPPQSRSPSVSGSYHADATVLREDDESGQRGRSRSQDTITARRESKGADAKEQKGNVLVSVRVRPDSSGTEAQSEREWMVDGRRSFIAYKGREGGDYHYDNVFSPHDQNARVYDHAAKRLVRRVMEGYHGTVFAYGMTGTGKTFSMQGTASSPGVIPLAISDIFSYIRENPDREFLLRVSYLEIYNEKIYDLLNPSTQQEDIKLREDSKRGVYATPLREEIVQSPNQLLRVIARGDLARRTSSTQFNARSSRSHAVVQIVVESRERTQNYGAYFEKEGRRNDRILPGGVLVSALSLIDLAGSERAAENKERRTEGAHINKSLLTLGTVIAKLSGEDEKSKEDAPKSDKDKEKAMKHLPYRDSKLTRLLQPALQGNSLVSILCTIQLSSTGSSAAAAGLHTGETLNTLKFASRAKNNLVSHAKRNESNPNPGDPGSRALLDRYRIEIRDLRSQLEQQNKAKEEAEKLEEVENDRKMEEELERQEKHRHEEQMLEMQLARTALKERISHLNRLILSSKSLGVNTNSGRFSSMSTPLNRMSTFSTNEFGQTVSVRSRDSGQSSSSATRRESTATLEVPNPNLNRTVSVGSMNAGSFPTARVSQIVEDEVVIGEEDDVHDDDGDLYGTSAMDNEDEASLSQQIRMLQADLSDRNRYIQTLETRLQQARKTSRSRVSMQFAARAAQQEDGGVERLLLEKDQLIDELRAKLDDQTRMVNALRSAARKRELLDKRKSYIPEEMVSRPPSAATNLVNSSAVTRRTSSRSSHRSVTRAANGSSQRISHTPTLSRSSSGGVINFSRSPLSPVAFLSPTGSENSETTATATAMGKDGPIATAISHEPPQNASARSSTSVVPRRRSVDEMTQLLDQMIQDKVDSGQVLRGSHGSLKVKRDTVMERAERAPTPSTPPTPPTPSLDVGSVGVAHDGISAPVRSNGSMISSGFGGFETLTEVDEVK